MRVWLVPNRRYAIGRRREYKSMEILEAAGYSCFRMAGSHGIFDIIGIGSSDVLLVQVKSDTRKIDEVDLEQMREFPAPENCKKLVHTWTARKGLPHVREL